ERFAIRRRAEVELEVLEVLAIPALRAELQTLPSLEKRRRIESLLEKLDAIRAPERQRSLRAVGVLEQTATPAARRVLQTLASGAEEVRLTIEAKSALERLKR